MMQRMRAAFMSAEGDDRFAADLDLNADGRIDLKDLAALRHQQQPERPAKPVQPGNQVTRPAEETSMIDRMRAAFMSVEGDDRFAADLDLHADGRIDLKDLAALRDQQRPASNEDMLQRMRASFLLAAGDDGFDASVDLNRDGRVDLADIVALRSRMDATTPVPPAEPAAGKPAVEQASDAATSVHNLHADHPDMMQSIRGSFMTRLGDDAYSAVADLNADGAVDLLDLAEWRSRNHEA
ncbi:MAG: hypothetical protein KJO54_12225 [Gammaproteobacteria bacterium]|nr:hypothetical protein [Gammaproteobacteria bacterium]